KTTSEATTETTIGSGNVPQRALKRLQVLCFAACPLSTSLYSQTCPSHTYLCDINWTLSGTKCYYISSKATEVSWAGGRAMCQNMGVDLVKIESREEQDFFFNKISDRDWFWIGLTDSQTEGDWRWTDGSSLNKNLTFWNKEPDDWKGSGNDHPEGEDCAIILKGSTKDKSWADIFCSSRNGFICETEANCQIIF
uniref:C-type lectin domain-containing protein n=1 Tax=Periophthalmus magnuspinnatus TaxID=409849 RepID=A0A3B3ZSK3_9GOBI